MNNVKEHAIAHAIAIVEETDVILRIQGLYTAKKFLNREMLAMMDLVASGELDSEGGHAAYKVLRKINVNVCRSTDPFRRELRKARERLGKFE